MDLLALLFFCCISHWTIDMTTSEDGIVGVPPILSDNTTAAVGNDTRQDPSIHGQRTDGSPDPFCKNNGRRVLNFCLCRKNFYGRYCQHQIHFRNCRHVPHGYWIKSDCDLCRCFDGEVTCVPHLFEGCDPVLTPQDFKKKFKPFEGKEVVIGPPGDQTDNDYLYRSDQPSYNPEDYYYTEDYVPSSASQHVISGTIPVWGLLCLLLL